MDSAVPCLLRQINSSLSSYFEENGAASKRAILDRYNPSFWWSAENAVGYTSIPQSTTLVNLGDNSRNKVLATATSNGFNTARVSNSISYNGVAPIIIGDNQHFTFPQTQLSWAFVVLKDNAAVNNYKGILLSKSDSSQYWGMHQTGNTLPYSAGVGAASTVVGFKKTISHTGLALHSLKNRYVNYAINAYPGKIVSIGVNGYESVSMGRNEEFTPDVAFGFSGTTFDPNIDFLEIIAGDTRLSEEELLGIELYLARKYSINLDPGNRWVQLGDSINTTQGWATPYMHQVFGTYGALSPMIDLHHDWNCYIMAVGGYNTTNHVVNNASFALAKNNCKNNMFGIHIGTNNIANGDSVANTASQVEIIAKRARSSGYSQITCFPMFDRGAILQSNKNLLNATFSQMKDDGVFDYFLSPLLIPDLCGDGASASLINFQDGTHPTTAGHTIAATAIVAEFSDIW